MAKGSGGSGKGKGSGGSGSGQPEYKEVTLWRGRDSVTFGISSKGVILSAKYRDRATRSEHTIHSEIGSTGSSSLAKYRSLGYED